jgi:hypothetical protein
MREEAVAWAFDEAPRFEAQRDCERKFGLGKCVESALAQPNVLPGDKGFYLPFVVAWLESPSSGNAPLFNGQPDGYQTVNGTKLEFVAETETYTAPPKALKRLNVTPPVKPAVKRGEPVEQAVEAPKDEKADTADKAG